MKGLDAKFADEENQVLYSNINLVNVNIMSTTDHAWALEI